MKEFTYIIKDEIGIHARPAGNLVKIAKEAKSEVMMLCRDKSADLKKIFSVLSLAAKCGDAVTIQVSGEDETEISEKLHNYLSENL